MREAVVPFSVLRNRRPIPLGLCLAAGLALAEFCWCVFHCDNDFLWHRNLGDAFLNNELYATSGAHYLPARGMIDAISALLPYRLDRALWIVGTCAALTWCVRFWSLSAESRAKDWRRPALIALLITGTYIHRDLAECGLQLFLLAVLTVGLWALMHGRPRLCGAALGLAIVYKLTPVLFLPYLIFKRQWKAAAWSAVFTAAFCLLPAIYVGWQQNLSLHRQWAAFAIKTLTLEDPSENGVEPPNLRNQSLPLLLARQVQHYPVGHPLHRDNPGPVQWAGLRPRAAKRMVQIELALLALAIAWRLRRAADVTSGAAAVTSEWAVVCIFVALLSPLCWLQHLVLLIPAALIFAQRVAVGRAPRWQIVGAAAAAALMLLVHRDLIGVAACEALSICQPHTIAGLLLAGIVLGAPRAAVAAEQADGSAPGLYRAAA